MINSLALFLPHRRNILISRPSAVAPSSLMRCGFFFVLFCFGSAGRCGSSRPPSTGVRLPVDGSV